MSISKIVNTVTVGSNPTCITGDTNYIWVLYPTSNQVGQIERSSGKVIMNIQILGTSTLNGISSDGTNVWISGEPNIVYHFPCSSSNPAVMGMGLFVGQSPKGLYSDGTNVWVPNSSQGGSVSVISCATGNMVNNIIIPNGNLLDSCYSDGTYVWVCNVFRNQVIKIQCSTGRIEDTIYLGTGEPLYLYSDGTYVWVSITNPSVISQLQYSDGSIVNNINLYSSNETPGSIVGNGTYFWVANMNGNNILQYECSSGKQIASIEIGGTPGNLYFDGTYLWCTVPSKNTVVQVSFSNPVAPKPAVAPAPAPVPKPVPKPAPTPAVTPKPAVVPSPAPVPKPAPPPPPPLPYILSLTNCMTLWQGTNPSNTKQFIWNPTGSISQSTGGPGIPNLQPNPTYATTKGKSTNPWINSGFTFAKGDFIGNNNGSLYLIMDMSGNLNLCTTSYSYYSGIKLGGNYYGGGKSSNAIYQLPEVGSSSLLNNVYYIDANADSHLYTSQYTGPSSNYTMFPSIDASGNNISQINNSSLEDCQQQCDNTQDCAGFVFDASNNKCFTKNSGMWPYGGNQNVSLSSNTYLKMNQLNSVPVGVSTTTNNIDSYTAKKYIPSTSSEIDPFGLAYDISGNLSSIASLESQIAALANQIVSENINFENNQIAIFEQATADKQAIEDFLQDYTIVENTIKKINSQEYLLKDSAIKVLQENYHYLLWSILAIGIVIVGVNVLKKKT